MQVGWGRPATLAGACCALPVQWFHAPRSTRLRCLQPNGYIFTSLVNACEKGGQWETAVRLFKAMQARVLHARALSLGGQQFSMP